MRSRAYRHPAIRLLARTWRIRTEHEERWRALVRRGGPIVFLLWHEALLPLLWHHREQGVVIVVSEAREGQYLADLGTALGYVRSAAPARGAPPAPCSALCASSKRGHSVAFTPDGPRGPPGAQARRGGRGAARRRRSSSRSTPRPSRAWRLHSWDRFMIPKPAARVIRPLRPSIRGRRRGSRGWPTGMAEAERRWRRSRACAHEAAGRHPPDGALAVDQPAAGCPAGATRPAPRVGALAGVMAGRGLAYRRGWFPVHDLPLPTVAVGNLTVGGSGKTPIAIWIARHYRRAAFGPASCCAGTVATRRWCTSTRCPARW